MAVALQSSYTKQTLQNLNTKNIKVLRHPDHNTSIVEFNYLNHATNIDY